MKKALIITAVALALAGTADAAAPVPPPNICPDPIQRAIFNSAPYRTTALHGMTCAQLIRVLQHSRFTSTGSIVTPGFRCHSIQVLMQWGGSVIVGKVGCTAAPGKWFRVLKGT